MLYDQHYKLRPLLTWLEAQNPTDLYWQFNGHECLFARFLGRYISLSEIIATYGPGLEKVIFDPSYGIQVPYSGALARLREYMGASVDAA